MKSGSCDYKVSSTIRLAYSLSENIWEHTWSRTVRNLKLMHSVTNKIKNKYFSLSLNSVPNPENGAANDVRYDLSCWAITEKEAQRIESVATDNEENIAQNLADIEIINLIECELNDPSKKDHRHEYSE